MKLAVTIDVEEEGLFSERYDKFGVTVDNVTRLALLDPIFQDWAIRPTLFLSYHVAHHRPHHDLIMGLKEKWKGEIGAHFHPWNTPPIFPHAYTEPVPSALIPEKIMREKIGTLFSSINRMGIKPLSFRMGRFDMSPKVFSLLEHSGVDIDSSIAPTRSEYGGASYLSAPTDPYFPDPSNPASPGHSLVLEVPLTILPFVRGLGPLLQRLVNTHIIPLSVVSWLSKYVGSFCAQPVGMGIRRLKAAIRLHRLRGGRVITIFFHSSELMPGASPFHPTDKHVEQFLEKLKVFLSWARTEMQAESVTLSQLYKLYA